MSWWRRLWRRSAEATQPKAARQRIAQRKTLDLGVDGLFDPGFPRYTALDTSRPGEERPNFCDSPEMDRLCAGFESELLSPPRRPPEDKGLLTILGAPSGVFTFVRPNSTPCLLSFSSPIRAGEYARVHAGQLQLKFLILSPQEFGRMLGDLKRSGEIGSFTLDPCPHCGVFPAYETGSNFAAESVVKTWAIHKASELARESLYFAHAEEAAAHGDFQEAKETALEAIQHVTSESPRLHLMVGKIALALGEKNLFAEARAFLEFLKAEELLQALLAAERSSRIQH